MGVPRLLLAFTCLALPASAHASGKPSAAEEAMEAKIRAMLNASGPAVDACTAKHLAEEPKAEGKVDIKVNIAPSGQVAKSEAQTPLPGARNLRACLEAVSKTWRFPPPRDAVSMSLSVFVKQGTKFRVPDPKEPPPAPAEAQKQPSGFITLDVASWLPGAWNDPNTELGAPEVQEKADDTGYE